MDYSELNNYLNKLEVDQNAQFDKRKDEIMNRDFSFFEQKQKLQQSTNNFRDNRLSYPDNTSLSMFNQQQHQNTNHNQNFNKAQNFSPESYFNKNSTENIVDLKSDINNRLTSREYLPNTGHLNVHGKNLPIIDRFPKSSKYMTNPQ